MQIKIIMHYKNFCRRNLKDESSTSATKLVAFEQDLAPVPVCFFWGGGLGAWAATV